MDQFSCDKGQVVVVVKRTAFAVDKSLCDFLHLTVGQKQLLVLIKVGVNVHLDGVLLDLLRTGLDTLLNIVTCLN